MSLQVARGLSLDPDYFGAGTFALLAKKGAGKSYASRVFAEEMWKAKVPFVLFDPMGVCWGLRSSADGEGEGIPVAIFGGKHGDAPLERTSGALMADLVIEEGLSMVLDFSEFGSHAAEREFAYAFLDRLYFHNDQLVHLLIDEADLFAPQKPSKGAEKLLGVMDNVVRRGRNKGIGVTLMTQRPAVLNKDVLTQIDGMVAMRVVGLPDREAVDHWVKGHGEDLQAAAQVKNTLASLENGESWWWVPELGVLKRTQIRRSRTFDSSPSRRRGAAPRAPKGFADVDMGAIETKMAGTIEKAKADDPRELRREKAELRKQIDDLQKQLATRPTAEPEIVEVPVLGDADRDEILGLKVAVTQLVDELAAAPGIVTDLTAAARVLGARLGEPVAPTSPTGVQAGGRVSAPQRPRHESPVPPARAPAPPSSAGDVSVSGPQQRILDALAALRLIGVAPADKTQLALFAQASPKSSSYTNNLGALRTGGLVEYPAGGKVDLMAAGAAAANSDDAPRTVEDLHTYVRGLVGEAKWRLLDVLVANYPHHVHKTELADLAGVSAGSSSFTNNLGSLRTLGLLDYPTPGHVAACPVLFLEAGR